MIINSELKQAGLNERVSLIIYLHNVSDQYRLRRYGDIVYFSKKMKYCVLYVDLKELDRIQIEISHLSFVKKIEVSEFDNVNLDAAHIEKQIHDLAQDAENKLQDEDEDLYN